MNSTLRLWRVSNCVHVRTLCSLYVETSSPCESNPCQNGGVCLSIETPVSADESFQCSCNGTEYEGPTCNRGIVTTPIIPTLFENEFNVSAKPSSEILVALRTRGLFVTPRQIKLNPENTSGTFEVTGRTAGHYTLSYRVFGPIADDFEMPESSPVLVSMNRSADRINRYFQYLDTDPGLIMESCCRPENLVYSECPMSTDSISFRSSCRWLSRGSMHETSGVVFAEFRSLILPLSISGINILYDGSGEISSGLSLSPVSFCRACSSNQGKSLTPQPLDPPDCQFDSGDVEDMLKSNSLANTFLNRITKLLPSWFSVSVPTNQFLSMIWTLQHL